MIKKIGRCRHFDLTNCTPIMCTIHFGDLAGKALVCCGWMLQGKLPWENKSRPDLNHAALVCALSASRETPSTPQALASSFPKTAEVFLARVQAVWTSFPLAFSFCRNLSSPQHLTCRGAISRALKYTSKPWFKRSTLSSRVMLTWNPAPLLTAASCCFSCAFPWAVSPGGF